MEIAIISLEDNDNINTKYGSNLITDGVVEFDTIN